MSDGIAVAAPFEARSVTAVLVVRCSECAVEVGRFFESPAGVKVTGDDCPHGGVLGGRPAAEIFNVAWSGDSQELAAACERYDVVLAYRAEPDEGPE